MIDTQDLIYKLRTEPANAELRLVAAGAIVEAAQIATIAQIMLRTDTPSARQDAASFLKSSAGFLGCTITADTVLDMDPKNFPPNSLLAILADPKTASTIYNGETAKLILDMQRGLLHAGIFLDRNHRGAADILAFVKDRVATPPRSALAKISGKRRIRTTVLRRIAA